MIFEVKNRSIWVVVQLRFYFADPEPVCAADYRIIEIIYAQLQNPYFAGFSIDFEYDILRVALGRLIWYDIDLCRDKCKASVGKTLGICIFRPYAQEREQRKNGDEYKFFHFNSPRCDMIENSSSEIQI